MHKGFIVYPLTIIKDRYGGAYSGSEYTAWNLDFYEIPIDITLSDISCMDFWVDEEIKQNYIIGKGRTAEEAVNDLYLKLEMLTLKKGGAE